jgi:type I restriction enzyme S subunit
MKPLTLNASQKTKKTPIGEIPVDWIVTSLGNCFRLASGETKPSDLSRIKTSDTQFPVYGGNGVLGFTGTPTFTEEHLVIGRVGEKCGCVHYARGKHSVTDNALYTREWSCDCSLSFFHLLMTDINLSRLRNKGGQPLITQQPIYGVKIALPPRSEQESIAKLLETWDTAITSAENLLATKRQLKTGLMQQLLTGKRTAKGRKWYHLGDLFDERVEIGRGDLPLLSITGDRGIVNRDDLVKKDTSSADKRKYLRIVPGDIGYNTMRMWQGVSALSDLEGIISPAYTVCIPKRDKIDGKFAAYLFKHQPVVHRFWSYSQGMVDDTLNLKFHNFAQVRVEIPPLETQREIATVLSGCDREIALLEDKLDCLREQKMGLMQKLLTGKIRVNPKKQK